MGNLSVNRGTTYTIAFQYKKSGENHTLVGATVRFTVKSEEFDENATDADALVLKNVTSGNSSGEATITINPSDTVLTEPGNYYYDIKVEESGGEIYKVDDGRFKLGGSPTNRLD